MGEVNSFQHFSNGQDSAPSQVENLSLIQKIRASFYRKLGIHLFLRQHRPGYVGKQCQIDPSVQFSGFTKNIQIDDQVYIGQGVVIDCQHPESSIQIGRGSTIKPRTVIQAGRGGKVCIGEFCSVDFFSTLAGFGTLIIGKQVLISPHSAIFSLNHHYADPDIPIAQQGVSTQGITIEDDVWIGAGAKILDGCTVGRGSVVGAGTVLTKSVEPWSIVAGVPGKVIRKRTNFVVNPG